ncbi:MAG: 2-hydroxyacyl-CoA dehydratase family protein, partial [Chloroflexota bacterium]
GVEAPSLPRAHVVVVGPENDDAALVGLIESLGGLVVADDHCSGSRYFWNDVALDGDLMGAIAARYLERPLCPAKDIPQRRRLGHVVGIAKDYAAQGVVMLQQKFCEPFEYEVPPLQARLRQEGIPSLLLEYDLAMNVGPMRSRIEAFLEMIELGV